MFTQPASRQGKRVFHIASPEGDRFAWPAPSANQERAMVVCLLVADDGWDEGPMKNV